MNRRRIPLYFNEAPEGGGEGQEQQAQGGGTEAKPGEQKADEGKTFTQAELDRILTGRLAKFADYDDVKTKLAQVEDANASETDKAIKAAREEARKEALTESAPRLVRAEFKAAAKNVLTDDQLAALLEDVDLLKFVKEDGDVDTERITKKITALAPTEAPKTPPSFGGGPRTPAGRPESAPGLARMRDAYAETSK